MRQDFLTLKKAAIDRWQHLFALVLQLPPGHQLLQNLSRPQRCHLRWHPYYSPVVLW
jgi:hypothetical protein